MAKKRITFTLDPDTDKRIRTLQVSLISRTNRGWSYSAVLAEILDEGLKTLSAKKITK